MPWRARYLLIGGVALATAVGVVGWHFFGGRGEVLKPDGGPVVTVMDFGQPFSLDPLPSGWQHRKFWTRSPMTMAFAVKDGVPSLRSETHDSASMLFRHVDMDLADYPMLAWRWYIELPIRSRLGNVTALAISSGRPVRPTIVRSLIFRTRAWELGRRGITVNAVAPGWIVTEMASAGHSEEEFHPPAINGGDLGCYKPRSR
jgi:hypothetical protein